MNKKIDFIELFNILKRDWLVLLATSFLGFAVAYLVTAYLITPQYQAETQLLVNRPDLEEEDMNYDEIQSNIQMISTYRDILTDSIVLGQVVDELEEPLTQEELMEKMTIVIQEDSQIFKIEVVDENPERAAEIVNRIAATFQENVSEILRVDNVAILSPSKINPIPISPRVYFNWLIGAAIGLIVGVSFSLVKLLLDRRVRDETVITEKLNWVLLATISEIPNPLNSSTVKQTSLKKFSHIDKEQTEEARRIP